MYTPIPDVVKHNEETSELLTSSLSSPSLPLSKTERRRRSILRCLWITFLCVFAISCVMIGLYTTFYIRTILQNRMQDWDLSTPGMYHEDHRDTNLGLSIHFFGAAFLMLVGILQYFPIIRRRRMNFHRWNGRLTLIASTLTALGGMYYIAVVGLSTAPIVGQQANVMVQLFGLSVLICGFGTYYHAAVSKRIDLHKLWAYRFAGLFFGNIFFRLYVVAVVGVLLVVDGSGQDPDPEIIRKVAVVANYIFFIPFILLADFIWRREQKEAPVSSTFTLVILGILLLVFIVTLALQCIFIWIPFMTTDLEDAEDGVIQYNQAMPTDGNN